MGHNLVGRKVSTLKFLLLFIAVGLAILLFLWPSSQEVRMEIPSTTLGDDQVVDHLKGTSVEDLGKTQMISPRFTGQDNKSRRWELTADQATQESLDNGDVISLDQVSAIAMSGGSQAVSFTAGSGVYHQKDASIMLNEGVVVHGIGFTLETEKIEGNLHQRVLRGESDVSLSSDQGTLSAGQFEVAGDGKKISLSGGVTGHFFVNSEQNVSSENGSVK